MTIFIEQWSFTSQYKIFIVVFASNTIRNMFGFYQNSDQKFERHCFTPDAIEVFRGFTNMYRFLLKVSKSFYKNFNLQREFKYNAYLRSR